MPSKATLKKMQSMFDGSLPIIKMEVRDYYCRDKDEYIYNVKDVEVLTVNFNTGSIRIRYIAKMFSGEDIIQVEDMYDTVWVNKVLDFAKGIK